MLGVVELQGWGVGDLNSFFVCLLTTGPKGMTSIRNSSSFVKNLYDLKSYFEKC